MDVLMGKSSINGPFSMAMLNNQRVKKKTGYPKTVPFFDSEGFLVHQIQSDRDLNLPI